MRYSPLVSVAVSLLFLPALPAQNSGRKIRPKPSPTAARAGMAVQWRADLNAALLESGETGKPVFWYVPTVNRSPMDRKPEIDRYMMAGPFSWPQLVTLLNDAFIPVKEVASGPRAEQMSLVRERFIEPGYVVLGGEEKELLRMDQLTTFHPESFISPLAKVVGREVPGRGELTATQEAFMAGVRLFHTGRSDEALVVWRQLADEFPDDPIGWKAAAEAEGHGPFRYGFEVFEELPAGALAGGVPGSRAPEGFYSEEELRRRSLDFLCRMQLTNGGWEDSKYDFGGTDSLPNVYTACTALIAEALLEELHVEEVVGDREAMELALKKAMAYLTEASHTNFQDSDELVWAHIYRVFFFTRYLELRSDKPDADEVRGHLQSAVQHLFEMQPGTGAWFHEYPNPFVTAEVLIALDRARQIGVELDNTKIARGLVALLQCRAKNGAISYGYGRAPGLALEPAAGRMPMCELALLRFGKSTQEDLERALRVAFEHHGLLEDVRKYDDHANRFAYGGFFFYFDMLGRTRAIGALDNSELRGQLAKAQYDLIFKGLPEVDGCFVDSHELGRTYGTAMALLCLANLR